MKDVKYTEEEINEMAIKAEKYDELYDKIESHLGTYDEGKDEFIINEDADVCSVGEIVLDYFDLWM